jgi:hypothetical protein
MEWPDMIERYDVVIVGAVHGGTQATDAQVVTAKKVVS